MQIVFNFMAIISIGFSVGFGLVAVGENDLLQNQNANLRIENFAQAQEIEIWQTLNATQNIGECEGSSK